MTRKYLSLEEAAKQLGMAPADLNRIREKGDIRAFADRGNWKFREDELQEYRRRTSGEGGADEPFGAAGEEETIFDSPPAGSSGELVVGGEADSGDQPTVIRKGAPEAGGAKDGDVRLVFDDKFLSESSQEFIVPDLGDSDSDVRFLAADSPATGSSVIGQAPAGGPTSDSDVKLISKSAPGKKSGEDSDLKLVAGKAAADPESIVGDLGAEGKGSSVLTESDSGISITGPSDSGIALEAGTPGGSSVKVSDLSIGDELDLATGSGIALEKPKPPAPPEPAATMAEDDLGGTIPMMAGVPQEESLGDTSLEVPPLPGQQESEFEFQPSALDEDAGMDLVATEEPVKPKGAAAKAKPKPAPKPAPEDTTEEEVLEDVVEEAEEVVEEVVGEDDALADVEEVFAEEGDFDEDLQSGQSQAEFEAPVGRIAAPVEQDWGAAVFTGLALSTAVMLLSSVVMYDLVRTMWTGYDPSGPSTAVLSALRGLFG